MPSTSTAGTRAQGFQLSPSPTKTLRAAVLSSSLLLLSLTAPTDSLLPETRSLLESTWGLQLLVTLYLWGMQASMLLRRLLRPDARSESAR